MFVLSARGCFLLCWVTGKSDKKPHLLRLKRARAVLVRLLQPRRPEAAMVVLGTTAAYASSCLQLASKLLCHEKAPFDSAVRSCFGALRIAERRHLPFPACKQLPRHVKLQIIHKEQGARSTCQSVSLQ